MDEQDYTSEYANGNSYTNEPASNLKGGLTGVKEKVTEQTSELKGKLRDQASQLGTQLGQKIDSARGRTSTQLRNTSQRIEHLASYVETKDAKGMSDDLLRSSQSMIRKYPGKSILVGLVAGLLLGRLFSGGRHSQIR
ncbi:hypothetical protein [Vampirovibrio sp.]|uniref:hypothetical protein n=1 Tax=Vampirovibrio sp. TaxID=2717857 RepID=UPI003592F4C3